jgi:2-keto-4-pentenoate hydratase
MSISTFSKTILDAYSNSATIPPLREQSKDTSEAFAYAIQNATREHWERQGRRVIGRKIGLTSKAVQHQLGVDQPDFGVLYADMAYSTSEELPYSRLLQPKAEVEICFVLGEDLDYEHHSMAEIIDAIDYALPAIEVADSRIENWDIKFFDTIADNASSGLFVLGTEPRELFEFDLELCGMVLFKNGHPVSTGAGKACLSNPLNAVKWLADKMVSLGTPLLEGDVILSGALGPMVSVDPGDRLQAQISGLGKVELVLST